MLGPLITQESIDRSPWWFRALFYTMGYTYLALGVIISVLSIPVAAIRHMKSRNCVVTGITSLQICRCYTLHSAKHPEL